MNKNMMKNKNVWKSYGKDSIKNPRPLWKKTRMKMITPGKGPLKKVLPFFHFFLPFRTQTIRDTWDVHGKLGVAFQGADINLRSLLGLDGPVSLERKNPWLRKLQWLDTNNCSKFCKKCFLTQSFKQPISIYSNKKVTHSRVAKYSNIPRKFGTDWSLVFHILVPPQMQFEAPSTDQIKQITATWHIK